MGIDAVSDEKDRTPTAKKAKDNGTEVSIAPGQKDSKQDTASGTTTKTSSGDNLFHVKPDPSSKENSENRIKTISPNRANA